MIEIIEGLKPTHALRIVPQKGLAEITPDHLFNAAQAGPAWTALRDGIPFAVGGHAPAWNGRTILWGHIGADSGADGLFMMTRRIRMELDRLEHDRVEAYVARNHEPGHRWIKLLGFQKEGYMRKFAHGVDYTLYAKVR